MPQSYRFHHFTLHQPGVAPERPHAKPAGEPTPSAQGLHYGHRFAETEERLHHRPPPRPRAPALPAHPIPIGALPPEEPPSWPETERLLQAPGDLLGLLVQRVGRWVDATRELARASAELVLLPREVLRTLEGRRRAAPWS